MDINTNVPLSIHPSVADRFVGHGDSTVAGHGRVAKSAFENAYSTLANVDAQVATINGDKDLSNDAKRRKVAEIRGTATASARETLAKEVERLGNAVKHHEEQLFKSAAPEHATASREEIRSYVRGLPENDRMRFVAQMAEQGDRQTVFSVLSAPTYLSGLDTLRADEFAALRRDSLTKLEPVKGTQLAELERLRDAATTALGAIQ